MNDAAKIGAILLAAGASKRLGEPKQLIHFKGKTLLKNSIDSTSGLNFCTKVVVLGAKAEEISPHLESSAFVVQINDRWEEGMGCSLVSGLEKSLELEPHLDAVLIMVVDQPFVSRELLSSILEKYTSASSIVACQYGIVVGVPVLFGKDYFSELLQLAGDQGAKKIMQKHAAFLQIVRFDQGNFDIDTSEDLEQLKRLK